MTEFVQIEGVTRAPAYIGNVYYNGDEKISMKVLVSDKKSFAPEVVALSEESEKLVAKTIKDLSAKAKAAKSAPKSAAPKAEKEKANAVGELPLV